MRAFSCLCPAENQEHHGELDRNRVIVPVIASVEIRQRCNICGVQHPPGFNRRYAASTEPFSESGTCLVRCPISGR